MRIVRVRLKSSPSRLWVDVGVRGIDFKQMATTLWSQRRLRRSVCAEGFRVAGITGANHSQFSIVRRQY